MKKKIALLLALIMTISLMPVTIFAESSNRVSKRYDNVGEKQQFAVNKVKAGANEEAAYFTIDLKDSIKSGESFGLKLDGGNSKWVLNHNDKNTVSASSAGGSYLINDLKTGSNIDVIADSRVEIVDAYTYKYNPSKTDNDVDYGGVPFTFIIDKYDNSNATVIIPSKDAQGNSLNINVKDELNIPLIVYAKDNKAEITVSVVRNNSPVTPSSHIIITTNKDGSTINTSTNSDKVKGKKDDNIEFGLVFEETRVGTIKTAGTFEIIAPDGWEFVKTPNNWTIETDGNLKKTASVGISYYAASGDYNESFYVYIDGLTPSTNVVGKLYILGIEIQAIEEDTVDPGDLSVEIRAYQEAKNIVTKDTSAPNSEWIADGNVSKESASTNTDKLGVSAGNIVIAEVLEEKLSFTSKDITTLISGRLDENRTQDSASHKAAKIVLEENAPGSWTANKTTTFTLPEGVKLRGIDFTAATDNLPDFNSSQYNNYDLIKDEITAHNRSSYSPNSIVTITETGFSFKNIVVDRNYSDKGLKAKIEFILYISISPDFNEEEIFLEIGGSAIDNISTDTVKIANVKKPIDVTFETAVVEVGLSQYTVSTITVKENEVGALKKGELKFDVNDEFETKILRFNSIKTSDIKVSDGDIDVTRVTSSGGTLTLSVNKESRKASTFTVSNLTITNYGLNAYAGVYDLVVYGDAVFANYTGKDLGKDVNSDGKDDVVGNLVGFGEDKEGFRFANFLEIEPVGGKVVVPTINSQIKLYPGSDTIHIDGKTYKLDSAPFVENATGTTYVPVRFLSEAMGMLVAWNDTTRTATITTTGYVIMLSLDSSTMFINGVPYDMTNALGVSVAPTEKNGRMYIPIRAFFEAFGCNVAWDNATNTATIN